MATRKTSPAAAEALGEKVHFEHNGLKFEIDSTDDWPYEVLEAYEDGKIAAFIRLVLGEEQHAAFKATKPRVRDVSALVEAVQSALGIAGN